jgi:hypothetical protein
VRDQGDAYQERGGKERRKQFRKLKEGGMSAGYAEQSDLWV